MRIAQVHNWHRFYGGEDRMFDAIVHLLKEKGHKITIIERRSDTIQNLYQKTHAFLQGIYPISGKKQLLTILSSNRPDVVHVHNLYPLFSPSILRVCKEHKIPVVLRCPDLRFICPISCQFNQDGICERCAVGREYWCILKNCRNNIFESIAYSLRTAVARKCRFFLENVTIFVPPSEFIKSRLVDAGFPQERFIVLPNLSSMHSLRNNGPLGDYIAYVGRISLEKGIEVLLSSARRTELPLKLAGNYSMMPEVLKVTPPNTQFLGPLDRLELSKFYRNARFIVVPSICPEAFGLVALEAMSLGLAVIASRIGGLPEIVEDGVTGFLFETGNSEELSNKMKMLWEDPVKCRRMGQAGREKAVREYSKEMYYQRLIAVYNKAITLV